MPLQLHHDKIGVFRRSSSKDSEPTYDQIFPSIDESPPIVQSHVNPFFVIANAGPKLEAGGLDALSDYWRSHTDIITLVYIWSLMKQASPTPQWRRDPYVGRGGDRQGSQSGDRDRGSPASKLVRSTRFSSNDAGAAGPSASGGTYGRTAADLPALDKDDHSDTTDSDVLTEDAVRAVDFVDRSEFFDIDSPWTLPLGQIRVRIRRIRPKPAADPPVQDADFGPANGVGVEEIDVLELGPRISKPGAVNVIAQVLPPRQRDVASPPPNADQLEERDTIGAMNARYRNLIQNARGSKSPSQSAKSANYRDVQRSDYPIYDGRYNPAHDISTMTPPIQLYNPAFARFVNDATNPALEIPDNVALAIYEDENTRRKRVRPALKNAISYGITQMVSDDRTTPDGVIMWTMSGTDGSLNETVALLIEEKRELGEGGSSTNDPDPSRFFPYANSFLSSDMPVHFEYVEALERDSGCVTFLCRTVDDTPRTVVVKFTQAYCPEAHKLLAAKGMAPELLYCGSVDHSLVTLAALRTASKFYSIFGGPAHASAAKQVIPYPFARRPRILTSISEFRRPGVGQKVYGAFGASRVRAPARV
ncbi:hypothetical protein B0H17DRAFT_1211873 [Mycena rosella]|uniref:Uncharacterized protein n=1 Tax=Mycena rosella TaxID=1033263 RepID=A0AAD7CSX9_MYCRO|nr:hypothetical protein B0H17DRAFT_1211873 [Mycena rosella]